MPTPQQHADAIAQQIAELKVQLADARRKIPALPVGEYTFASAPSGAPVTLAQLFGDKRDLIVIHNMGRKCAYCTLWADGFAGLYKHLADRAAFVLSSPDEPAIAGAFASARHWPFPVVSIARTSFAKDMGFANTDGGVKPGASAFHKDPTGAVTRSAPSAEFGPGDDFCSLWHLLDLLKDGPSDWAPKYHYA